MAYKNSNNQQSIATTAGKVSEDLQKKNQAPTITPAQVAEQQNKAIEAGKQEIANNAYSSATSNEEAQRNASATLQEPSIKLKPVNIFAAPKINAPDKIGPIETQKPKELSAAEQKAEEQRIISESQYNKRMAQPEEQQPRATLAPSIPVKPVNIVPQPTINAPEVLPRVETQKAQAAATVTQPNNDAAIQLAQQQQQLVNNGAATIPGTNVRVAEGQSAQRGNNDVKVNTPTINAEDIAKAESEGGMANAAAAPQTPNAFSGGGSTQSQSQQKSTTTSDKQSAQSTQKPQTQSSSQQPTVAKGGASTSQPATTKTKYGAGEQRLGFKDIDAIHNFQNKGKQELKANDTKSIEAINRFRESLGLKPIHVASKVEKKQFKKELKDGKQRVYDALGKKTWRDYLFGSKTDQEWNKKRKAKILALRDVLSGWANLYATTKGAPAMKIGSTLDEYEKRLKEQDAAKAAKEKADRDFQFKQNEADRDFQLKLGDLNISQNKDKRDQDKHPYELAKEIAKANEAKTKADTEAKTQADKIRKAAGEADLVGEKIEGQKAQTSLTRAKQKEAEVDAAWAGKEHAASVSQKKASAANSYAAAATQKARRAQIQQAIRNNGDFEIPSNAEGKNWRIAKSQQATLKRELQGIAKKKGWYDKYYNSDGSLKAGVKSEDLLIEAFAHTDDTEVQYLLGKHGRLVNVQTDAKTRRKVATTLR